LRHADTDLQSAARSDRAGLIARLLGAVRLVGVGRYGPGFGTVTMLLP
jgi:hypothetical protein